jgi:hypothetical protein
MIRAFLCGSILICSTLLAQDYPANEFFAGYSASGVVNLPNPGSTNNLQTAFRTRDAGTAGYDLSYIHNFSARFGIKADFSSYIDNRSGTDQFSAATAVQPYTQHAHAYNFLFGPEWRFANHSRFTPFVYGLTGIAHVNSSFRTPSGASILAGTGTATVAFSDYEQNYRSSGRGRRYAHGVTIQPASGGGL